MTNYDRRHVAFHEAGHTVMSYWRNESLHGYQAVLFTDRYGGESGVPMLPFDEWDLMVLLGGPMAEGLSLKIVPEEPLLFRIEYRLPGSDSSRIRALVKMLRGKFDRPYLMQVQERCRKIIQEPRMWRGITMIVERLLADDEISGEESERILEECRAPQFYHDDKDRYPIIQLPCGLKLDDQGRYTS